MTCFAPPPAARDHLVLDVNALIGPDHPERLFDELLRACDWAPWEKLSHGRRGQPPIPPRILAAILLYGLTLGFRSSRTLEYLCRHNLDFLWLASPTRNEARRLNRQAASRQGSPSSQVCQRSFFRNCSRENRPGREPGTAIHV